MQEKGRKLSSDNLSYQSAQFHDLTCAYDTGQEIADWFGGEGAKVVQTFFSPLPDLFKSVTSDHCNRGTLTGIQECSKLKRTRPLPSKRSVHEKVRDKISTGVPRLYLDTARQEILGGQMSFGIWYFWNLRKAVRYIYCSRTWDSTP